MPFELAENQKMFLKLQGAIKDFGQAHASLEGSKFFFKIFFLAILCQNSPSKRYYFLGAMKKLLHLITIEYLLSVLQWNF